jgi:hypothetical protein
MRLGAFLRGFVRIPLVVLGGLAFSAPASAFIINPPGPYPIKTVLEYFNEYTGHYVLLSDPGEIAGVDAGAAGIGWKRTGYSFDARNETLSAPNICRFYGPSANSHFFTGNAEECDFLRSRFTGWIFEKLDFSVDLPVAGACPADRAPIYRLYNNRWMFDDSSHRFIPDADERDAMVAKGWIDEGVGFCALNAGRIVQKSFVIMTNQIRPSAECENEAINLGPCIALNQIPPLPNAIVTWLPPYYITHGPYYSDLFYQLTGSDADVHTSRPVSDTPAVAAHSFVQVYSPNSSEFGIHVSHLDRTVGKLASINPLYQFTTGAPTAGTADARVFPWRGHEAQLVVSFNLRVKTIRQATVDSHAYGHPTLQFKDTASGHHLYVTLGAYGTGGGGGPPGDLLAIDGATQRVIVGTAIKANPGFGKRLAGQYLHCDGTATTGTCDQPASDAFALRLARADFQVVLDRARTANAELSASPDDYILANFHFNNEIHLGGEIGMTLGNYRVELYGY